MNKFFKILFVSLTFTAVLSSIGWADSASILTKAIDGENLMAIARNQGRVRVIIKLDVPNIADLTAASSAFNVSEMGEKAGQMAREADADLASAISSVSGRVISNLKRLGSSFDINHTYATMPLIALNASENALNILASLPEVTTIVEDRLDKPLLDNTVGLVGAKKAWAGNYTGEGWYVAILDTGIRKSHEFFAGKSVVEACYALGSDGTGPEGDCPNGQTSMTGNNSAVHYASTYEGYDHGTHVAGIATGNNGSLFGVAKDANIIAVQVFSRFSSSHPLCDPTPPATGCVLAYNSDQLAGLEYVYSLRTSYNIASVNISIGGGAYASACDDDIRKLAIDNLRSAKIATVAASGNDAYCGAINAPACVSTAIAVGATDTTDYENDIDDPTEETEAGFNNWSDTLVNVLAPGVEIYSSTGTSNSSYESWNGTSMATPHVAGAFALLRNKYPSASVTTLLGYLTSTGVSITTLCPSQTSKPRIRVDSAMNFSDEFPWILFTPAYTKQRP